MSVKKVIYSSANEVWSYFNASSGEKILIIVPNPIFADSLRAVLKGLNLSEKIIVDTISHFIKERSKTYFNESYQNYYRTNSELFQFLGVAWLRAGHGSFVEFNRIFKLLTDLRSFSTELDLFHEYFAEIEQKDLEKIIYLWTFMNEANIWDEQSLYSELSCSDLEESFSFCIYGFDYLSGNQIDFINSIARTNDVYVPIPMELLPYCTNLDWVNWLEGEEVVVSESSNKLITAKFFEFESNNLLHQFNEIVEQETSEKKGKLNVLLADTSLDLEEELQYIFKEMKFKLPVESFEIALRTVKNELLTMVSENSDKTLFLENIVKEIKLAVENRDYKKLKLLTDFKLELESIQDQFSLDLPIDEFLLDLLFRVVEMNLPRLNLISEKTDSSCVYRQFKNINVPLPTDDKIVFIIKKKYNDFFSFREVEESIFKLASIGPIKRPDFDYEFKKANFYNAISNNPVSFLVERGTAKEKVIWKDIFSEIEAEERSIELVEKRELPTLKNTGIESKLLKLSASKIQTYMDCPRKYYYKYMEKLNVSVDSIESFSPRDEGIVMHEVVEKFLVRYDTYEQSNLNEQIQICLESYLEENKKTLNEFALGYQRIKLFDLTHKIVQLLIHLKNSEFVLDIKFEEFFEDDGEISKSGYIDILVMTSKGVIILDLKRSGNSIPSMKSFCDFSTLQLWFYACHSGLENIIGVGYLCGDDVENSIYYSDQLDSCEVLAEGGISKIQSKGIFNDSKLDSYRLFEKEIIDSLLADNDFLPGPSSSSICDFCDFSNICPKGGMN